VLVAAASLPVKHAFWRLGHIHLVALFDALAAILLKSFTLDSVSLIQVETIMGSNTAEPLKIAVSVFSAHVPRFEVLSNPDFLISGKLSNILVGRAETPVVFLTIVSFVGKSIVATTFARREFVYLVLNQSTVLDRFPSDGVSSLRRNTEGVKSILAHPCATAVCLFRPQLGVPFIPPKVGSAVHSVLIHIVSVDCVSNFEFIPGVVAIYIFFPPLPD